MPPEHERRLVMMGRVVVPFGVQGWLKVQPFSATPENLLAYPTWWMGDGASWRECRVDEAKTQSGFVVAKLAGCDDRDAALLYRGLNVAVPREALPEAGANEFYWADLIGLRVVNAEEELGTVSRVFETGANDVLVVEGKRERLIPFTAEVVQQVDVKGGVIRVDWGSDY